MAQYSNGARVEIRAGSSRPWFPGEVVRQDHMQWEVDLDAVISADQWSGIARKYGGGDPIGLVAIFKATENVLPGSQIKPEGA